MEFEPWMLLIFPLFFGMGWWAARLDIKDLVWRRSAEWGISAVAAC